MWVVCNVLGLCLGLCSHLGLCPGHVCVLVWGYLLMKCARVCLLDISCTARCISCTGTMWRIVRCSIFALWLRLPPGLVRRLSLAIDRAHVTTMAIVIRLRDVVFAAHRVCSITAALIGDLIVIILVLIVEGARWFPV